VTKTRARLLLGGWRGLADAVRFEIVLTRPDATRQRGQYAWRFGKGWNPTPHDRRAGTLAAVAVATETRRRW